MHTKLSYFGPHKSSSLDPSVTLSTKDLPQIITPPTTASMPPTTHPNPQLTLLEPAFPSPDALAFAVAAVLVLEGACVVVPGPSAIPSPVVEAVAELLEGPVDVASVGATKSKIEDVKFAVESLAEVIVDEGDDVVEGLGDEEGAVVLGMGNVIMAAEAVSIGMPRKCVATASPVKVVNAVRAEPPDPPVALHARYVVPSIAQPRVAILNTHRMSAVSGWTCRG